MEDNTNLLRKSGERFLPKVADAIFEIDGIIAYVARANTASAVTITMNKNEKRGGQNNAVLGAIYSDTAVEASFTAGTWQPEFLAAHIGSVIQIGKFNFLAHELTLPIADGKVTLPGVPADKRVQVYVNNCYVALPAETAEVDVSGLGLDKCAKVMALLPHDGKRINLGAESTPMVGKLTLKTPLYEGTKGQVGESQYVFPAFQMDGNWTHNFANDATYELKGSAIAVDSEICGEGQSYGYYQEYLMDEKDIMQFSALIVTPGVVELTVGGEPEKLTVYGVKGATYAKTLIEDGVTFASEAAATATVSADGTVTAVAAGSTTVTATYKKLKAVADVNVAAGA